MPVTCTAILYTYIVALFVLVVPSKALHVRSFQQGQDHSGWQMADCPKSRTDFDGTFDVVITWYTTTSQSKLRNASKLRDAKHSDKHSDKHVGKLFKHSDKQNISKYGYSENHGRIENQNEITYLLRGIDQFGMLSHVGNIFIVLDKLVVQKHGAPRHVNWKHPKIKAIYTQDLGIKGASSISAKMASFHMIPGIAEWFLYLQDDIMIARPFSNKLLFAENGKSKMYLGEDLFRNEPGNCPTNHYPINEGPDHLPWMVNKCYMEHLAKWYSDYFTYVRTDMSSWFSARCTYDSWMNGMGLYETLYDKKNVYGEVCHLGIDWAQCPIGRDASGPLAKYALEDVLKNPATFLNLQGSGMSDDYPNEPDVTNMALKWLHDTYKPSPLTI